MQVSIEKATCYGWQGFKMSVGDLSLGVVPDIGGRIISLKFKYEELVFVQAEHMGEVFDFSAVSDLDKEKTRLGFRLWGGDKTWVAPQSAWTCDIPPLELDAGKYEATIEGNKITMKSSACRETGVQIVRSVEMLDTGKIVLEQTFINRSDKVLRRGIWDVTQVLRPFDVYLSAPIDKIRAYENEGDSVRLKSKLLKEQGSWTKIICDEALHFKFGGLLDKGRILALRERNSETLGFLRTFEVSKSAEYLHGSSAEIYNSPDYNYLEIEAHAPFIELQPGEQTSHSQHWFVGLISGKVNADEAFKILTDIRAF